MGGQGRVYRPQFVPASLGPGPLVVKRLPPGAPTGRGKRAGRHGGVGPVCSPRDAWPHAIAAWPLAVIHAGPQAVGRIVMRDVSARFAVPFVMPSGRREHVLLTLEHLLGADWVPRAARARRPLGHGAPGAGGRANQRRPRPPAPPRIAASDIAPNNLLVAFGEGGGAAICFIDCDSMAFLGRTALETVQTGDWDIPAQFGESSETRAAATRTSLAW